MSFEISTICQGTLKSFRIPFDVCRDGSMFCKDNRVFEGSTGKGQLGELRISGSERRLKQSVINKNLLSN